MRPTGKINLDTQLLSAFDAIYREGNVTRAAARLGISQSTLSHSLSRLRTIFDDELFVRTSTGVRPTPKTEALHGPIAEALAALYRLEAPYRRFEPTVSTRTFRLLVSDDLAASIVPGLCALFTGLGPGLRLEVLHARSGEDISLLDLGTVDVAVGVFMEGETYHRRHVLCDTEPYVVVYDPALIGTLEPLSIEQYVELSHLGIQSSVIDEKIDVRLAALGHQRRITVRAPHALSASLILRRAPLLATMAHRMALTVLDQLPLATSPLPFPLEPEKLLLVWHDSVTDDPANLWFRQKTIEIANNLVRGNDYEYFRSAS